MIMFKLMITSRIKTRNIYLFIKRLNYGSMTSINVQHLIPLIFARTSPYSPAINKRIVSSTISVSRAPPLALWIIVDAINSRSLEGEESM